jgi:hypothetical protein
MGYVYNLFSVQPLILGEDLITHSQAQELICTDLSFFHSLLPFIRICDQESANPFQYLASTA